MRPKTWSLALAVLATVPAFGLADAAQASTAQRHSHPSGHPARSLSVGAGQTYVVEHTTRLRSLTIATGGALVGPDGKALTLTVNGVETGGRLTATSGTETRIRPGTYRGDVVLTVTAANPVAWQTLTFPFRQALYVGPSGIDATKSVFAAVGGGPLTATAAKGLAIRSTGENFNGVYVKDGPFTLLRPRIALTGNGRSDFVGYGAAIVATGTAARVVVDGADIDTKGAVRTGVVADGGSNVVVKNSRIHTEDGTLPDDYTSTVDLAKMQSAPWMLGIAGNVRATNLLGIDTKASYINSDISSSGWGVLSTDTGRNGQLTAINSRVAITGADGYGSYAIGNATERFLGTRFDVPTYATINRGGAVSFADSTRAAVSALNDQLDLGLSQRELGSLPRRSTVIESERWGVMWHGAGTVDVSGGTRIATKEATFLDKGQQVGITVDGSQGARLTPANGVLFQLMEDDDPGPQMVDGELVNTGVYQEPTGEPAKAATFDPTTAHADDATATFTDISLQGDFYNAVRGGATGGGPFGGLTGKNMVLTFADSAIAGTISATRARHALDTIRSAEYRELGMITNTPRPVVNNGVLVDLAGDSRWTVTGTSYLSRLTVGPDAAVVAPKGKTVSMTVDGAPTPIVPGTTYAGAVVLTTG